MRQGIRFHDGTPLTMEDLQYAIEQAAGRSESWNASIPTIVRISSTDDATLVVEFAEFLGTFPGRSCGVRPSR